MVEWGTRKIAQTTVLKQRKYHPMCAEVNSFPELIRNLNRTALAMKTAPLVEKQREFEAMRHAL